MKAFIEGTVRMVEPSNYINKKTNTEVVQFRNYVQDEAGAIIKVESRENHTTLIGREAVLEVEIRPAYQEEGKFRITLLNVKPAQ